MPVLMHMAPDFTPLPHIREPDELYGRQQVVPRQHPGPDPRPRRGLGQPRRPRPGGRARRRGVHQAAPAGGRGAQRERASAHHHGAARGAVAGGEAAGQRGAGDAAQAAGGGDPQARQPGSEPRRDARGGGDHRRGAAGADGPSDEPAVAAALAGMGHGDFAAADRLLAAIESATTRAKARRSTPAQSSPASTTGSWMRGACSSGRPSSIPTPTSGWSTRRWPSGSSGDFPAAVRWAEQALERAQRRGDRLETVRAATCLGAALQGTGDFQRAGCGASARLRPVGHARRGQQRVPGRAHQFRPVPPDHDGPTLRAAAATRGRGHRAPARPRIAHLRCRHRQFRRRHAG